MTEESLLKRADELMDKLLEHNLQFSAQTGAAQIVDDLIVALRLTTTQDAVDAERWRAFLSTRPENTHEVINQAIDAAIAAQKGKP